MSPEDEVRSASERFYTALNRMLAGDAGPLSDVWSHGGNVTAMHPVGGREVGWERVAGSWSQIAQVASGGQVMLRDRLVQVAGDMACEVGVETGQATLAGRQVPIEARVTNVYRREAGAWRMVHHHADLSPAMQDVVRGQQAGS
jgi:ketosteroid isomerase-like protein